MNRTDKILTASGVTFICGGMFYGLMILMAKRGAWAVPVMLFETVISLVIFGVGLSVIFGVIKLVQMLTRSKHEN